MTKPKIALASTAIDPLSSEQRAEEHPVSGSANFSQDPAPSPVPLNEEQALLTQVLEDLDYIQHKEKGVEPANAAQAVYQTTLRAHVSKLKRSAPGERLLGIIGPCGLPGHIAHFYNLQAEIEKHIKSVSEFGDERLVAAYNYLKSHPSTEAIFVYENRMTSARRVRGRLVPENISLG